MFELTEIMRQRNDLSFANMLNHLREGNHTEKDLAVFKSRSISLSDSEHQRIKNTLHLFPCNAAVDSHNQIMYDNATAEKAEVNAIDTVLGEDSEDVKRKIVQQLKGKKTNDTGNLSETLRDAVGLCYDTTNNVSVTDGICNGTSCSLEKSTIWKNKNQFQVVYG